jgi:hypothetical protein
MRYLKSFNESNEFDFTGEGGRERLQNHITKIKEDPEYKKRWIEFRDSGTIEYWKNLKPFQKESDVPDLPKPLTEFHIKKLIECGAIPKSELKDGEWYYGNYRNSEFGKWNSNKNKFDIIRYKFGLRWDDCYHFEDDDGYALFVPLRLVNSEEMEKIMKTINEMD